MESPGPRRAEAIATKDMASMERAMHEKAAESSEQITEEEKKMKQHFLLEMQKLTMEEGAEEQEAEREQEGLKAAAHPGLVVLGGAGA